MPDQCCYCLDTSFFINGWRKLYRIDVFPTVWTEIEARLGESAVCSCEEVFKELEVQSDTLLNWAKQHKHVFHTPTDATISKIKIVMSQYRNFAAQGGNSYNAADPWVVAQAMVLGAVVVTDELPNQTKDTKPPKIPKVCEAFNIKWMSPIDFLKHAGICI